MPIKIVSQDDLKAFITTNDVVILDFCSESCEPCKMMGKIFEEIDKEVTPPILIGKIDTDKNRQVATDLCIQYVPTLMFFHNGAMIQFPVAPDEDEGKKKGKKKKKPAEPETINRIEGLVDKEDVLDIIRELRKPVPAETACTSEPAQE